VDVSQPCYVAPSRLAEQDLVGFAIIGMSSHPFRRLSVDTDIKARARELAARDPFPMEGFSHVEWWVGNAYQSAMFLRSMLGFAIVGYRGPETGERETSSYLLESGNIRYIVTGSQGPEHPVADHVHLHGPGVHDVAFAVPDAIAAFELAVDRGAEVAYKPVVVESDYGKVVAAGIGAYGDTIHSLVQRDGGFPEFEPREDLIAEPVGLHTIDHVVANVELGRMNEWVEWYERIFGFTMLKHFDDEAISTEYTALMSKVMWDGEGIIKLPINEPADGRKRSQIEEYLIYYRSPGVQHIAMATDDLQATMEQVHRRGLETISVPDEYYTEAQMRIPDLDADWDRVRDLRLLVDKDEGGHLLQIFTKMLQDRPTVFFELIERRGATGFGIGNFKALFEAIEREQAKRGNL
jgi:4-hydroxyphenylpyruvate dioxygenase